MSHENQIVTKKEKQKTKKKVRAKFMRKRITHEGATNCRKSTRKAESDQTAHLVHRLNLLSMAYDAWTASQEN